MLSGRRVQAGDKITDAQADELLAEQCEQWVVDVAKAVSWAIDDVQASVLISFTHNLGAGALSGSTLAKMANAGRIDLAADQLNGWAVAGGAPQLGLLRRREYERRLFAGEAAESQAAYDAVWRLGTADLMPLYQRAFAEAKAWGWQPDTPAVALHAGAAVAVAAPKPLSKPTPVVSPAQSTPEPTADELMDAFNPTVPEGDAQ
jgi:lysozyme